MFSATAQPFELAFRFCQFLPYQVTLARQFVTLGKQRYGHGDVARAGAAN
jgi:hypothetical protein